MLIDLPEPVDITIKQGDTWISHVTALDAGQSPVNLTGYGVEFNISRTRRRHPTWSWRNDPYRAIVHDAENGVIRMGLRIADIREFNQLEHLAYDLVLISPSGIRTTIMTGTLRNRLEAVTGGAQ